MMRIAVAGGLGLGFLLATSISRAENAYNVVVLSRTPRREFAAYGIQVHVVDYREGDLLRFALQGIDLVISTISGQEQLNLINAAARGRVRYFVPSEFEGGLSRRPPHGADPLDRGSHDALALLRQWSESAPSSSRMKWTVFSCGVFMERFHPYGMARALGIGTGEGVGAVGSYVADVNAAVADYAPKDDGGRSVKICLTSVFDVVRFVIAALDLGPSTWPNEFTMRGDRKSLRDVVGSLSAARNIPFQVTTLTYQELHSHIAYNTQMGNWARVAYLQRLLETANGRYDFSRTTLNDAIDNSRRVHVQALSFPQWLATIWT